MIGILCFGDSITFGRGEQPCLSWVGRLKSYFEPKDFWNCVYNLGIAGETSADLLKRFDSEAQPRTKSLRQDKYIIIISIGLNDTRWDGLPEEDKPRVSDEEFENNIKELIKKAQSYSAELVFLGLTPVDEKKTLPFETTSFKNEKIKSFNDIIKKNCEESNVLFLDIFDKLNNEQWSAMLADGVHPNEKGYDQIYGLVKDFLIEKRMIK
jgi:acyl-CoA thioesterase I